MEKNFFKIAQKLVQKGDALLTKNHQRNFSVIARDLLEREKPFQFFSASKLLRHSFSLLPSQNFKTFEFSDLPLTVARGKYCFVDVYFWRRRPTTIHNHHFTGAFQCLEGLNVETEFSWKASRKLTRFHTLGTLTPIRTNVLRPGDTQAISLQDDFIHQSHHHADLTINLCFRTPDLDRKRLASFLFSGLKMEKDTASLRQAQLLFLCSKFESMELTNLKLKNEDLVNFLLSTYGTTSNPQFLALQRKIDRKLKLEIGVSVLKLLQKHDTVLDEIQESYE